MFIYDVPFWMFAIGWVTSQLFKIVLTMFLIILCLNKIDQWVAKRGKTNETIHNPKRNYRSGESQS